MKHYKIIVATIALNLATQPLWSADLGAGKAKFDQLCATCHGAKGHGDGAAAASLKPTPKDLTKTAKTDAELRKVITQGGAAAGLSPIMPAWGGVLSDADVTNIIAYIRTLK